MAFDPNSPAESHAVLSGDINQIRENCVQLRKHESGASAPSNLVAGMLWYDTNGPYLKIRRSDNGGWYYIYLGTQACVETGLTVTPAQINTTVSAISGGNLILDPTPDSDGTSSGLIATMTVDANATGVAAALHLDSTGGWIEADADAVTTMPCAALALETGTGSKQVLLHGFMRNDVWTWTVGAPIYVSTTAGGLTQTAPSGVGDQVQVVGIATHADRIFFNPNYVLGEAK